MSGRRCSSSNVSGHLLIKLCGLLQGCPGILRELSRLCSNPANAFPLGVVNVPEIIQSTGLPNLCGTHARFILSNILNHKITANAIYKAATIDI